MRTIYKQLVPVMLAFFTLSSCQKNTAEELAALNSFLNENYEINAEVLYHQKQEYRLKAEELPNIRNAKLDTVYATYQKVNSTITHLVASNDFEQKSLENEYNGLLTEIEDIVQKDEGYTITPILNVTNVAELDTEYKLRIMQNNLVMAMSYAFEYVNNSTNIQPDMSTWKHIDTDVSLFQNRVQITLSSAIAQSVKEKTYIYIDKILLNGSKINITPTISKDDIFANIVLDSLESGKYFIQGKLLLHIENKMYDLPFMQKFEVR